MSQQSTLTDRPTPYRSIVKDAYTTRDDSTGGQTRLEIAVWRVDTVTDDDDEDSLKDESGNLRYNRILDVAMADLGAEEIARRSALKSYADDRGGRAASTVRGYKRNASRLRPKSEGGLPSSHPVKRVLRRYARSNDLGHFEDDSSTDDEGPDLVDDEGDAAPIEMSAMFGAYKLARSIASQAGFVFAPQSGEPVAIEDNERLDPDEVRPDDRPVGDTKAAAFVEKPNGSTYEYQIDLDTKDLESLDDAPPGGGWSL
jgi:hypothetical protein